MIRGSQVALRPATEVDRRDVYRWLTASDVTASIMGPPTFPDVAIPSWNEFCADYESHFFTGSRPRCGRSFIIDVDGQSIGHISYSDIDAEHRVAELDIWMRSQAHCGHGYGTDALRTLMRHLADNMAVRKIIIRPSSRNRRAVNAYYKAGFRPSELSPEEQAQLYGHCEYSDTITLECEMSASSFGRVDRISR